MQVLTDKPLGFYGRLKTIQAGYVLNDLRGWWRVLLFGRTGPLPKNFSGTSWTELGEALPIAAALTQHDHLTADELTAALAVLTWVPKPVEFEWFVADLKLGKGIWVDAFIDTQIRGMEHDGWEVVSWIYPTESYHRRFVLHASRRMCPPLELVDAEQEPER
jgi:hypothetical protein